MDDINIMSVNKYIPKIPDGKDGSGYDSDYKQVIEPSFVDVQTTVDYDSTNFKYGLDYADLSGKYSDPMFFFQDPLFPIFDIVLDTRYSPLFIVESGTTYKYGLSKFLDDYGNIPAINARKKLHSEFLKTLYFLFNTNFNQLERNKSYYINSIEGLNLLTKKMVDFEKDKITITLNEDLSMISSYLSNLYKNLAYSYKEQRYMIPANLLRFNMYIKISDVRNMSYYIPEGDTGTTTKFDKSYIIYVLRDCSFNFFDSKNFDDSLTVGGFDAGKIDKPASLKFDIYYKSIEIETENPLIMDSFENGSSTLKLNNKDKNVESFKDGLNTVFLNNASSPESFNEKLSNLSKYNNDNDLQTSTGRTNGIADSTYYDHDKFYNKVSSDTENTDRTSDLEDIGRIYEPAIINSEINSDSTVTTNPDVYFMHSQDLADVSRPYEPSVSNSEWNYGYSKTTADIINDNMNLLDSLNGQIYGNFLFELPFRIINMFLGGIHGLGPPMPPLYINTSTQSIPYPENWRINTTHRELTPVDMGTIDLSINPSPNIDLGNIDTSFYSRLIGNLGNIDTSFTPRPLGNLGYIPFVSYAPKPVDMGYINLYFTPHQLGGLGVIPFASFPPKPVDMGYINLYFTPHQLGGLGVIPFASFPPKPVDMGYINLYFNPHPFGNLGNIDTSFTPHQLGGLGVIPFVSFPSNPVDMGYINLYFNPHVFGNLGNIDTSFTPHQLGGLGNIDNSFNNKLPLDNDRISISIKPKIFGNMGNLYQNIYNPRIVDLGVLFLGVDHSNIMPLTYLFTKRLKFNDLHEYHIYNNAISINKELNNLRANDDIKKISPFELIFSYENSVNIKKTLDNIVAYNNEVNRNNNIEFETLYQNSVMKRSFDTILIYNNAISAKEITQNYLYSNTSYRQIMNVNYLYNKIEQNINFEKIYKYNNNSERNLINLGFISMDKKQKEEMSYDRVYEQSSIKKLLDPIYLYKFEEKNKINLDKLYDNEIEENDRLNEIKLYNNIIEANNTANLGNIIGDNIVIKNNILDEFNITPFEKNEKQIPIIQYDKSSVEKIIPDLNLNSSETIQKNPIEYSNINDEISKDKKTLDNYNVNKEKIITKKVLEKNDIINNTNIQKKIINMNVNDESSIDRKELDYSNISGDKINKLPMEYFNVNEEDLEKNKREEKKDNLEGERLR